MRRIAMLALAALLVVTACRKADDAPVPATPQAAQEYINTILSEHDKVSVKQLEMADPSDINRYLEKLRKAKQ